MIPGPLSRHRVCVRRPTAGLSDHASQVEAHPHPPLVEVSLKFTFQMPGAGIIAAWRAVCTTLRKQ